jgi:hypothetical protein
MNITEKVYKRLTLKVTLTGFSYCVFDTLHQKVEMVKEVDFNLFPKTRKVEEHYARAFRDPWELRDSFDEILVLHDHNLNTFVPKSLFDEQHMGSYLQYNTKVFESDFFNFDALASYEMNNVYIPYVNINNYLLDQFGTFNYKQANSILVSKLLDRSKNIDEKQVFVHFSDSKFELVVIQNQKLLLFNSFDYQTKEDFIYYLLFTAEQLNLNPEHFRLQLLGNISEDSELFKIAYKFVRNVSLLDVSDLQKNNPFSTEQNLKHFIIFQS